MQVKSSLTISIITIFRTYLCPVKALYSISFGCASDSFNFQNLYLLGNLPFTPQKISCTQNPQSRKTSFSFPTCQKA